MKEELCEFVEDIPNTYAYPYMARIMGEDPVYHFQRNFIRYEGHSPAFHGTWYTFILPYEGVYEICTKRFDSSHHLLERDRSWFAYFDGEFYDLDYADVLFTVWNINAQLQNSFEQLMEVTV